MRASGRAQRRRAAHITLAAISLAFAGSCTSGGAAGVTVSAVGYGTVAQVVEASANVTAKAEVTVSAPAGGSVAELDVTDGQQVTAGQILGRISSPDAEQELTASKQAVKQASAGTSESIPASSSSFTRSAASARTTADKAFAAAKQAAEKITDPQLQQAVLDQISAAQSSYDTAFSALSQTITEFQDGLASAGQVLKALGGTQVAEAQAAEQAAQQTVDALTITAPISGTVTLGTGSASGSAGSLGSVSALLSQAAGSSSATGSGAQQALGALSGAGGNDVSSTTPISEGVPVSSGGTLFTVTNASALAVTAQVDETDILLVKPGVTADIELNAVPGATYKGTVLSVDPNGTTSSTGGVTFTVHLSLGAGKLATGGVAPAPLPGMSAIANLNVLTATHALAIPSAALLTNGNTTSVWLVRNGVAQSRQITLGAQGDTTVQVLSGLSAGDLIVTAGADKVTAGEHVG